MTRGHVFLVVLAGVLVAANVRAGWEDAVRQAVDKAYAERAKKAPGMTSEKLKIAYPTPEMVFSDVPTIAPGQTATVLAQGKFQPDTTFIVESDDVEVQSAQLTPKGWKATLKAKADAWPNEVTVLAIAPVSGIQQSEVAVRISAKYAIEAQLANGWSVTVTPDPGATNDGGPFPAKAQWFKGGSKSPFRTGAVYVAIHGGEIEVNIPGTEEETAAALADADAMVGTMQDALPPEQMEALTKKMEACDSVPPAKMEACMAPYIKQMEALSKAAEAKVAKTHASSKAAQNQKAFGCLTVRLSRDGNKVTGSAEGCEGAESVEVKSAKLTLAR